MEKEAIFLSLPCKASPEVVNEKEAVKENVASFSSLPRNTCQPQEGRITKMTKLKYSDDKFFRQTTAERPTTTTNRETYYLPLLLSRSLWNCRQTTRIPILRLGYNHSKPPRIEPGRKRHKKMETISSVFRHSFRRQSITSPNTDIAATATSTIDTNNNSPIIIRKKSCTCCGICGKRLLKLAKWSNYITIPCKSRHVFCKECFNERLKTRQKVLTSLSFDLMWTFPCPGHDECGQEISVDWSRGSRFSRNLVARNMVEEEDVEFILEPENTSEESFDQDTSGQLDLG
ncbi:hypothetical protein C0Q70_04597 [Pomacea canaliculata]|uniref:Uncharacterized protein n=1 Tax=Pomacea canaliculata TaxID=400727 RepID=A0A2T7PIU1_POMCA|nr:hypothetical protein C0Q70_04597 [Pomacea canaliculata]